MQGGQGGPHNGSRRASSLKSDAEVSQILAIGNPSHVHIAERNERELE